LAGGKGFGIVSYVEVDGRLLKGELEGAARAKLRSPRLLREPGTTIETARALRHCRRFL
jgi:hypothetical protein